MENHKSSGQGNHKRYENQRTIIRKLDYIAAGGIINMVNMVNIAVNNNIYAGRNSGSKYN